MILVIAYIMIVLCAVVLLHVRKQQIKYFGKWPIIARTVGQRWKTMGIGNDGEFFDGECPDPGKSCYEWECDTCEVEVQGKEAMKAVDDAEYKEWFESEPQESEE